MPRTAAIICALLALLCLPATPQGLLTNGDFSNAQDGWPAGWQVEASSRALYAHVDDDGRIAPGALRYHAGGEAPAGPVTQEVPCTAGAEYVLIAALKTDGATNPLVRVVAAADGRVLAGVVARGEQVWTPMSAQFNAGAATTLRLEIFGAAEIATNGLARPGTALVDDVQVYPLGQVPAQVRPTDLFSPPGPNLALGRPYTVSPRPNYPLCRDEDDAVQLTDGQHTVGYFWTQPGTVGWMRTQQAEVVIDLGEDQPIAGVSWSAAAGVAGVQWPNALFVLVSEDGQRWYLVGDLVRLSNEERGEPEPGYRVHRFATSALRTHGRYVRIIGVYFPFLFVDEVEVYRGPEELLAVDPPGEPLADPKGFVNQAAVVAAIHRRLTMDLSAAREALTALPEAQRGAFEAEADDIAARIAELPPAPPEDFTTVLPLSELHARIYALNAPVLRARGFSGLTAWGANRWDPLLPTQAPEQPPAAPPALRVDMMRGETRAVAVNLTNATDDALTAVVAIRGLPSGDNADWVSVREVLFTDTREQRPIAAALPPAPAVPGGVEVTVPAGMTRQVWLSMHTTDVEPGTHEGRVVVTAEGVAPITIPLTVRIFPFDFPEEPTLSLGGWDYTDTGGVYGVNAGNMMPLIEALRAHYVNMPWATRGVMPSGGQYDAEGRLIEPLDFTAWDRWIARWPGARYYSVFLRADGFEGHEGEPMGTPRFDRMVGEWITAWVQHMGEQGIAPEQLQLLIVDEPTRPEQSEVIVAWARALKAAQPRVRIWEDTRYAEPWAVDPKVFELCDVLCPNTYVFLRADQRERDFYLAQQAAGTELWFYDCSGPGKSLDPYAYHRGQMWAAIRYGALGCGYWAFGSSGGAGCTSWNAYAQTETEYSPLFIGADSVTDGKHMEAIREGIEDYEYFVMLRARVAELRAQGIEGEALARAETLLTDGPRRVTEPIAERGVSWADGTDRSMMDTVRVEVLEALKALRGM